MKITLLLVACAISMHDMHDGELFPLKVQKNIVSRVWDDDTLGSLSLVNKAMRSFVFDEQSIAERKKKLLRWHEINTYANDTYLYACYQTLETHIFNKRHSALMVTNRYRKLDGMTCVKPAKHIKHQQWVAVSIFDADAVHGMRWGYIHCDGHGYNGIPYFSTSGQSCAGRIDDAASYSVTDYVFAISKQSVMLEKKKNKEYYIDFEDGTNPQPLVLLYTRFKSYAFAIMNAPIKYETPTTKVCAINNVRIENVNLSPTTKQCLRDVFKWLARSSAHNSNFACIREQLVLLPAERILTWALFAAHGGYKRMYVWCVQCYWDKMMWPSLYPDTNYYPLYGPEFHYRFAQKKCAVDDTKKFYDYLYADVINQFKGEQNFRIGTLQRYIQFIHPCNVLAYLHVYCTKIYSLVHQYLLSALSR